MGVMDTQDFPIWFDAHRASSVPELADETATRFLR
jgi:hypothetical protein